ncbi:hypothetical protein ACP70R_018564 [Stipagrostis hirtigluma subsp. patula]
MVAPDRDGIEEDVRVAGLYLQWALLHGLQPSNEVSWSGPQKAHRKLLPHLFIVVYSLFSRMMDFPSCEFDKDGAKFASYVENLSQSYDFVSGVLEVAPPEQINMNCKVNDVDLVEPDDTKVKDFSFVSSSNDDSGCSSRSAGFRLRLESIFGHLLSARLQDGICNLFDSHCQKVPQSLQKQSELLIINLLQLLKKSIICKNSAKYDFDSTSSVSGPYDDILEFLDEADIDESEAGQIEGDATEVIPDFIDEFCDEFMHSLDMNDMNYDPDMAM